MRLTICENLQPAESRGETCLLAPPAPLHRSLRAPQRPLEAAILSPRRLLAAPRRTPKTATGPTRPPLTISPRQHLNNLHPKNNGRGGLDVRDGKVAHQIWQKGGFCCVLMVCFICRKKRAVVPRGARMLGPNGTLIATLGPRPGVMPKGSAGVRIVKYVKVLGKRPRTFEDDEDAGSSAESVSGEAQVVQDVVEEEVGADTPAVDGTVAMDVSAEAAADGQASVEEQGDAPKSKTPSPATGLPPPLADPTDRRSKSPSHTSPTAPIPSSPQKEATLDPPAEPSTSEKEFSLEALQQAETSSTVDEMDQLESTEAIVEEEVGEECVTAKDVEEALSHPMREPHHSHHSEGKPVSPTKQQADSKSLSPTSPKSAPSEKRGALDIGGMINADPSPKSPQEVAAPDNVKSPVSPVKEPGAETDSVKEGSVSPPGQKAEEIDQAEGDEASAVAKE
ncbi:hypothetical protein DFS34DRAFT_604467 [Phlyctochytrium arcticum]|nr:hypothetical protein DFS34DRAFT_604467 [Phlyctochytrium arcticum]